MAEAVTGVSPADRGLEVEVGHRLRGKGKSIIAIDRARMRERIDEGGDQGGEHPRERPAYRPMGKARVERTRRAIIGTRDVDVPDLRAILVTIFLHRAFARPTTVQVPETTIIGANPANEITIIVMIIITIDDKRVTHTLETTFSFCQDNVLSHFPPKSNELE